MKPGSQCENCKFVSKVSIGAAWWFCDNRCNPNSMNTLKVVAINGNKYNNCPYYRPIFFERLKKWIAHTAKRN